MKKFKFIQIYLALVFFAGCSEQNMNYEVLPQMDSIHEEEVILSGQAYVQFTEDFIGLIEEDLQSGSIVTKSSELNSISELLGVKTMTRLFPHAGEYEPRTRKAGLHRWYKIIYDETIPVTKANRDLSLLPGVELVEPVRRVKSTAVFNDPKLSQQWHYYNDGTLGSDHKEGSDINVIPVWENYTTGDKDVKVCVVDSGIDYNHEDLAANYVGGYNFVRNTTKVVPGDHGTHVAGTIAAINNNGIGVSGIAGGDHKNGIKGVGLLSAQIFEDDPDNPGTSLSGDQSTAIKWGADNGAVISQNSWGYVYKTEEEQAEAVIPSHLKAAIDYFIKYAGCDNDGQQLQGSPMKGGVVIFAAGNDSRQDNPIGKYEPVISVGSIGPDFNRAPYSTHGDWVDIAAPGGNSKQMYGDVLSTTVNNGYSFMQGTSMACPHVSGVAALIVSHFKGPGFTNEVLREKLIKGANASAISKNAKIGPLLDAFGAMTYGGTRPPKKVTGIKASASSNNIELSWTVPSDPDDKKAYGFVLVASKEESLLKGLDVSNLPEGVKSVTVMTGTATVGSVISGVIPDLEFSKSYYTGIVAFDYNRNYSELSDIYLVTTGENNPPLIETDYSGNFKVKSHETLKVIWNISDPDNHSIDIKFTPGSKAVSWNKLPDGSYEMEIVGNADEPGNYDALIKVEDSYGGITEKKLSYEILPNHAPVIIKDIEDMIFDTEGQRFSIDMSEYLEDPDGEQLKFEISISDRTVLHINPVGNILNATTLSYGVTEVTIKAIDSRGLSCELPFKVLIKDPSRPVEVFPNPVKDWLTVSTMQELSTRITIVSSTGKSVYDATSPVSAFNPAEIDMRECAPGVYKLTVEYDGQSHIRNIVKL